MPEQIMEHLSVGRVRVEFANTLRGIAALLVVTSHYVVLFWASRDTASRFSGLPAIPAEIATPEWASRIINFGGPVNLGALGVSLFFMISGFVIPFSVQRLTSCEFLIGRFFRIWPTYFVGFSVTVLSVFIATYLADRPLPFPTWAIFPHLIVGVRGLIQSPSLDGVVWTLEVETGFYVLVALTASQIRRASLQTILVPLLLACICVLTHLLGEWTYLPGIRAFAKAAGFAPYMIFMFSGVVLHFLYRGQWTRNAAICGVLFCLACAAIGVSATTNNLKDLAPSYIAGFLIFLASMAAGTSIDAPRLLRFFASISYPLYVVHPVVGYISLTFLITSVGLSPLIATVGALSIAITLAWLIHVFVEEPTRSAGGAVVSRMSAVAKKADDHGKRSRA